MFLMHLINVIRSFASESNDIPEITAKSSSRAFISDKSMHVVEQINSDFMPFNAFCRPLTPEQVRAQEEARVSNKNSLEWTQFYS